MLNRKEVVDEVETLGMEIDELEGLDVSDKLHAKRLEVATMRARLIGNLAKSVTKDKESSQSEVTLAGAAVLLVDAVVRLTLDVEKLRQEIGQLKKGKAKKA